MLTTGYVVADVIRAPPRATGMRTVAVRCAHAHRRALTPTYRMRARDLPARRRTMDDRRTGIADGALSSASVTAASDDYQDQMASAAAASAAD